MRPGFFTRNFILKIIALCALFFFYAILFIRPLNITSGDLGRHITNGKILVNEFTAPKPDWSILYTNYYSQKYADFPFTNHHWASGVIFFLVFSAFGLAGLQLFFTGISVLGISVFLYVTTKITNFWLAISTAFFLMPLIATRRLIRPELISYLCLGLVLAGLWLYVEKKNKKYLLFLPVVFLIWVNSHIYFIFGFAVLGIFWLDALVRKSWLELKQLSVVTFFCLLFGLINPFGYAVYTYPFTIVQNSGLQVIETKPLVSTLHHNLELAVSLTFEIAFILFWFLYVVVLCKDKTRFSFKIFLLALLFSGLAWHMLRNISLFGLMFVPLLAVVAKDFWEVYGLERHFLNASRFFICATGMVLVCGSAIALNFSRLLPGFQNIGVTPLKVNAEAADFLKNNQITGIFFNDFSSGSYLIFHFYPDLPVFVDQRPEAYPLSFFTEEFYPLFRDEAKWKNAQGKNNFGIIFLTRGKASPNFIIHRLQDPDWALVFVNSKSLIFVRRNVNNSQVIAKFEITKEKYLAMD